MKTSFLSLLVLTWLLAPIAPAVAQSTLLTRGEVYKLINQAQLLPNNRQPRPARLRDVMVPQDALMTASKSRAELLFNEGSLARIGPHSIFRFTPGMRGFQLRHGTALILSPSQQVAAATKIEFPGGEVATLPSPVAPDGTPPPSEQLQMAMLMIVDASNPEAPKVQILALADINLQVTNLQGQAVILRGGQLLTINNGVFGPITTIDLRLLYNSTELALGLGEGARHDRAIAIEAPEVRKTLDLIRPSTLAVLRRQTQLLQTLEGLCTLNARGGSSTLASNCITTTTDDPLRNYQDHRQVTTVEPPRPEIVLPPPPPPEPPLPPPPPPQQPSAPPRPQFPQQQIPQQQIPQQQIPQQPPQQPPG